MKYLFIIIIASAIISVCALGMAAFASYAIKRGCAEKIADGTLTESERAICRRHGHL